MKPPSGHKKTLTRLSQEIFNTPLMIEPAKAEVIIAAVYDRLNVSALERLDGTTLEAKEMLALAGDARRSYENWKPFHMDDDIAVIPVDGTLVHKYGHLDPYSGMTGYDGIARKFRAAMKDDDVKAVWLDIDSPGGSTSGCFELCYEILKHSQSEGGKKPVWAYVDEQACSAAYAIASVCDKIYAPRTGMAGSIGCYLIYTDWSKRLDAEGLKTTIIRAGERKARITGTEPLDKEEVVSLQAWVDDTRQQFAELVAAGRNMTVEAVLATEARWYTGHDAAEMGLIDSVMGQDEAWDRLKSQIGQDA